MLVVKDLIILHNLCTDHVTVRSELTYLIGAKAVVTINLEPRFGSSLAKYPWFYVRAGLQPAKKNAVRVFGRVWNRAEQNRRSQPGPLAGHPDQSLTRNLPQAIWPTVTSRNTNNVIYGVTARDLATDHAKEHASARSRDA